MGNIFEWAKSKGYLLDSDNTQYYTDPATSGASAADYRNFVMMMNERITDAADRLLFFQGLIDMGALPAGTDAAYWADNLFVGTADTIENLADAVSQAFGNLTADPGGLSGQFPPANDQQAAAGPPGLGGGNIWVPPVQVGDMTVYSGGTHLIVTNEDGTIEHYIVYDIGTADHPYQVAYFAGNQEQFDDWFPAALAGMNSYNMGGAQFRDDPLFGNIVGDVEEMNGSTESLGVVMAEELALLGFEGLPTWMTGDETAMTLAIQASNEGWSPDRTALALSGTQGFANRFPGFKAYMALHGDSTVLGNISNYLNDEEAMQNLLRHYRPHGTVGLGNSATDYAYVGELLGMGWTPQEAEQVLLAEMQLNDNPEALDDLNAILASRGMAPVTAEDFLNVLTGNTDAIPGEIYDAINDALFLDSLAQQGIEVDGLLSETFGVDVAEQIAGPGAFDQLSRDIAVALKEANIDLAVTKFGLTTNDIIVGLAEGNGEILGRLAQLSREREAGARGLGGTQSQIDERGRLRIAGLTNV